LEKNEMYRYSITNTKLNFDPQNLHLGIWESKSREIKGVIAACHGLTSHGTKCYHYFGPYMAEEGWTTFAPDLPGLGHWEPETCKAERTHWTMMSNCIETLMNKCKKYCSDKKIVLIGNSVSALSTLEYVINNSNRVERLPDSVILISPALSVSFPKILYPFFMPFAFFAPNLKLQVKRFEPDEKSNDPLSIINFPDCYELKKISFGMLFEIFKSQMRLKVKRKINPMNKWPINIPLLIITGGNDVVTDTAYSKLFYEMLPSHIKRQYIHYADAHHYILYEANREEIFHDMLNFINGSTLFPSLR
jgi:alpha-beta hydrolase superfamily lysophospholipase